jgi:sporulation protein YtfJ
LADGSSHPIEGLMHTVMESLREMIDVNTILGDPVETPDGAVIVPVSRVSFGFAAGGTDQPFSPEKPKDTQSASWARPFGGGSGAGMSVNPVAFLVVRQDEVRLMPVEGNAIYDRLLDVAPKLLDKLQGTFRPKQYTEKPAWVYDGGGTSSPT